MITNNKVHTAVDVTDNYNNITAYGPSLEYIKYQQEYMELMNEMSQRKAGVYGVDEFDPASFNQAWTVTGKTNDDEDRATVKNLTGNGNNLVLSNFAFAEESGYGLYNQNFKRYGFGNLHLTTYVNTSSKIELSVPGNSLENIYSNVASVGYEYDFNIKVTGLKDGSSLKITKATNNNDIIKNITKDGVYSIKATVEESWSQFRIYFWIENKDNSQANITIEQIPDYEGYLVTDGVDDKIQSSNFELGKDWTMVGNWILLQDTYKPAGVVKTPIFYIYNNVNGMVVYLKSGTIQNKLPETKSLYAVCSDGRVYDNDWNEYQLTIGSVYNSSPNLRFGVSLDGTKFTKIAFKNLAIYNDKVLTKDQCIKAYDYLQTLKEK